MLCFPAGLPQENVWSDVNHKVLVESSIVTFIKLQGVDNTGVDLNGLIVFISIIGLVDEPQPDVPSFHDDEGKAVGSAG